MTTALPITVESPAWFSKDLASHARARNVRIVSVDVETTSVSPHAGSVTEVGYFDLTAGTGGVFIPPHRLDHADPAALEISRYAGRIAGRPQRVDLINPLHQLLGGDGVPTTIVGSNPAFDMAHLELMFQSFGLAPKWKRRPICVAQGAYWLGIGDFGNEPGLAEAARSVGVDSTGHHDAGVDALMAAAVFTRLWIERASLMTISA